MLYCISFYCIYLLHIIYFFQMSKRRRSYNKSKTPTPILKKPLPLPPSIPPIRVHPKPSPLPPSIPPTRAHRKPTVNNLLRRGMTFTISQKTTVPLTAANDLRTRNGAAPTTISNQRLILVTIRNLQNTTTIQQQQQQQQQVLTQITDVPVPS